MFYGTCNGLATSHMSSLKLSFMQAKGTRALSACWKVRSLSLPWKKSNSHRIIMLKGNHLELATDPMNKFTNLRFLSLLCDTGNTAIASKEERLANLRVLRLVGHMKLERVDVKVMRHVFVFY
jgi:hypothetical protein